MKYVAWVPVIMSAKFEAEIDPVGKTEEEIKEEFIRESECQASLCWHCSNALEPNYPEPDFREEFDIEVENERTN